MLSKSLRLYLVASKQNKSLDSFLNILEKALQGGVDAIQLREKSLESRDFYTLALKVGILCKKYNKPFIINDRLDIALAVDADGLHIGQQDLPLAVARRLLGKDKILGLSINCKKDLQDLSQADYLGVGAVFATPTKKDSQAIGMQGLKDILNATSLGVVAIGGINAQNISDFSKLNLAGVAVVRAIMDAKNPQNAARDLKKMLG